MGDKKHLKHEHHIKKSILGFVILFIFVILVVPYYLRKYAPFAIFVTYFANIDIIANILAINFPAHFHHFYDPINQTTIGQYLSYNLISIIALSGIFFVGLHDDKVNKEERFAVMIIMSIITWTLPTQGLPYLNTKIDNYLNKEGELSEDNKRLKVLITVIISLCFIVGEFFTIKFLLSLTKSSIIWVILKPLIVITILGIGLFALKDSQQITI